MKKELQRAQGERLSMLRKQLLSKTQAELGSVLDVSTRSLNRYENGQTPIPEIFYTTLEMKFPNANIDWIKRGVGVMYLDNADELSIVSEEGQEPYKSSENMDCEKKLALANAEIKSLRAQLSHHKLLLQAFQNQ